MIPSLNLDGPNVADMEVRSISLRTSLGAVSFVGTGDIVASRFCSDSRKVQPGDIFVALRGSKIDGHQHIDSAIAYGAAGVIVERPSSRIGVPQCIVANTRTAYAKICMECFGSPQQKLNIIGVTGTNGKTTTTWLLRSILETAERITGMLGTLEYFDGRTSEAATLTTPDCEQLARYMARMHHNQVTDCVMEISSHALHQYRCVLQNVQSRHHRLSLTTTGPTDQPTKHPPLRTDAAGVWTAVGASVRYEFEFDFELISVTRN